MVKFASHRHVLSFDELDHIIREWCDGQDPSVSLALWSFKFIAIASFMTYTCSYDYEIMQLSNTGGTPCVLQTSQHNWMIIKMFYKCLRRCLLGWHRSRLGFVTLCIGDVYLGPLGNAHHISPASNVTNELVAGWCITEQVKRLASNEIEIGMAIPTIESRASNIPMTKGTTYVVMRSDR